MAWEMSTKTTRKFAKTHIWPLANSFLLLFSKILAPETKLTATATDVKLIIFH